MLHARKRQGQEVNSATIDSMLPEVFECPQCQRQFVFELVESSKTARFTAPNASATGEKDIN
jgi:hypothetical protein